MYPLQDIMFGLSMCALGATGVWCLLFTFERQTDIANKEHIEINKFIQFMEILGIDHSEILSQIKKMGHKQIISANKKLQKSINKHAL